MLIGWSARQTLPRDEMHDLSEPARVVLERALDAGEKVDILAPVVGSFMVLTDHRLIVVREGADYRPKTGIRSFALDRDLEVRIAPTIKQVTVASAGRQIALFIRQEQQAGVEALLAELRRRIYAT
jgi:hypothetical protein